MNALEMLGMAPNKSTQVALAAMQAIVGARVVFSVDERCEVHCAVLPRELIDSAHEVLAVVRGLCRDSPKNAQAIPTGLRVDLEKPQAIIEFRRASK